MNSQSTDNPSLNTARKTARASIAAVALIVGAFTVSPAQAATITFYEIGEVTESVDTANSFSATVNLSAHTNAMFVFGTGFEDRGSDQDPANVQISNGSSFSLPKQVGIDGEDGARDANSWLNWTDSLSSVTAGNHTVSWTSGYSDEGTGSADTVTAGLWVIEGVLAGATATGAFGYDDGSGSDDAANLAFNDAGTPAGSPNFTGGSTDFDFNATNVVLGVGFAGGGSSNFTGTVTGAFETNADQLGGAGGSALYTHGIADSDSSDSGWNMNGGWVRFAGSGVSFAVPEPSTFVMLLGGIGMLFLRRRRA